MQNRKGFTLIELLIVVVIIGILAAIAIPKFSATRERAYFSAMQADLRNLATQQEIYYTDGYIYTTDFDDLEFTPSEGVLVTPTLATDAGRGWAAVATHEALGTALGCAVFHGEADPPTVPGGAAVENPGVIECNRN